MKIQKTTISTRYFFVIPDFLVPFEREKKAKKKREQIRYESREVIDKSKCTQNQRGAAIEIGSSPSLSLLDMMEPILGARQPGLPTDQKCTTLHGQRGANVNWFCVPRTSESA